MYRVSAQRTVSVVSALATLTLLAGLVQQSSSTTAPNKLLLLLIDGFRWDYFDKIPSDQLPGFTRLRQNGVAVEAFVPAFPSLSFVNYYTIMTGLHPESNGMVDNYMYDPKHGTEFLIGNNDDQYHSYWWDDGEPLWVTATKQCKRSYWWIWNGCEVAIRGYRPTFCRSYQTTPHPSAELYAEILHDAVEVLRNDSADLAGVFIEKVDAVGHYNGSESNKLKEAVKEIDSWLVRLLDALSGTPNVNLMVFSDHGMTERLGGAADARSGLINVLDYINSSDWAHAAGSKAAPGLQIWPKPDNEDWLYERLRNAHPNMTVYKKEDIPERYHLKKHYRVPPLLLEADFGYVIVRNASTRELPYIGFHGYDNTHYPDMFGIYFASGPDFKSNAMFGVRRLPNVNVYQLMCHVMQLNAAPHNGTWSNVCDALADKNACADGPYSGGTTGTCVTTTACGTSVTTTAGATTARRQDVVMGLSLAIAFAAVAIFLPNSLN